MHWVLTHKGDQACRLLADRHYTRQTIGSSQFCRPGRNLVLRTPSGDAVWVTWQGYRSDGEDAWECTIFRNESPALSSDLIRQAIAATVKAWGPPPPGGFITYVGEGAVRSINPGFCFLAAGWRRDGRSKRRGLLRLRFHPKEDHTMSEPVIWTQPGITPTFPAVPVPVGDDRPEPPIIEVPKGRGFTHESARNATAEWFTPPWIFELLGLTFDLDPCHPMERLPWVPAADVYTKADNGLVKPWHGRVWLNPPYGQETPHWMKLMHERAEGVALLFARTDTGWFHDYVRPANGVLFLNKRVRFVQADGKVGGSPGSGSMLVAWGRESRAALINAAIAKKAGTFADLS